MQNANTIDSGGVSGIIEKVRSPPTPPPRAREVGNCTGGGLAARRRRRLGEPNPHNPRYVDTIEGGKFGV